MHGTSPIPFPLVFYLINPILLNPAVLKIETIRAHQKQTAKLHDKIFENISVDLQQIGVPYLFRCIACARDMFTLQQQSK